jgi:hypothetical protein
MPPKNMHGARARVHIIDRNTGQHIEVGIWNNFSYQVNYDVQPSFVLGRYSAAELTTTGVEPVSITAQGFRVVNHGPFETGRLTSVQTLLTQEYLRIYVLDRQTGKNVAVIDQCLPTGTSSTMSAKQLTESTCTYVGLLMDDESTDNAEAAGAADFPPIT